MLEISIANRFLRKLSLPKLQEAAAISFDLCGRNPELRVALHISTNRVIRAYNKRFRGMDEITDVLSFENEFTDPEDGTQVLGDILISIEKAQEQADAGSHSLQSEVEMLLVHGLLHLCGYDHSKKTDFEKMSGLQDEILCRLGNPLRKSIHPVD